jgi:hypothetical protein
MPSPPALHVTNGDSAVAALAAGGIEGRILPWRDVLHDGPVPAGLAPAELAAERARFLAAQGWGGEDDILRDITERDAALAAFGDHGEVVLWFEHDLYDQLQLIQVLDFFSRRQPLPVSLSMVGASEYIGPAAPERIAQLFRERSAVTAEQLATGTRAWAAFRSPDPRDVQAVAEGGTANLPHLAPALRRHLQQFPSVRNGLSRSEQQALEAIAAGAATVADAYLASHHQREEPIWMGDATFVSYLLDLGRLPWPLVAWADGSPLTPPPAPDDAGGFISRSVMLTDAGRDVMEGRADRVRLNGLERWLGGVHLSGRHAAWRWDEGTGRIVPGADPG